MNPILIALVSLACTFGGALLGLAVRSRLPEHHLREDSKDAVKMGAGMIATLSALVLGLLVSSAKGSFDTMSNGIIQAGAKAIMLDRVLAQYGPETGEIRHQLRRQVSSILEMFWSEDAVVGSGLATFERATPMELVQTQIRELKPQNDAQRAFLSQAQQLSWELMLSRWLAFEQAQSVLPVPFLVIMLFWVSMLYASFGLLAPPNATVMAVLFLGAVSISTAVFLILEMNSPLDGMIRISSAPLHKTLDHLGK